LSFEVVLDNQYVYREFGNLYLNEALNIELDKTEGNFPDEIKKISDDYLVKELSGYDGDIYGSVRVGIDSKLLSIIHVLLVLVVIPIAQYDNI
jgi:hypothetical protein